MLQGFLSPSGCRLLFGSPSGSFVFFWLLLGGWWLFPLNPLEVQLLADLKADSPARHSWFRAFVEVWHSEPPWDGLNIACLIAATSIPVTISMSMD